MQSKAATVEQYLASLPDDRRAAISAVRKVILSNLDKDYAESMQYGMIGYNIPHSIFPAGYHCDPKQPLPFAALASQKNHMAVYLMCVYGDASLRDWFQKAWIAAGKKLDMGSSCIRFQKLEDVALDVLGEAIRRIPAKAYIERYVQSREEAGQADAKSARGKKSAPARKPAAKKTAKKKAAARPTKKASKKK